MNILVIGYYNRKNLGDDIFEKIFEGYFNKKNFKYEILNIDDIRKIKDDVTHIVFGGGDLINDYFISKMNELIKEIPKRIPIYAIGIGIPYLSLIGYLDKFDYIFSRNIADLNDHRIKKLKNFDYAPDLSLMSSIYIEEEDYILPSKYNSKKIGVFLSRTIYNENNIESYNKICDNIASFIKSLLERGKRSFSIHKGFHSIPEYEIYLIPFCTENKIQHNDQLINNDIYNRLHSFPNLYRIKQISVNNVMALFKNFDFTICTRFHAHMFSIMCNVPFLSIYTTKKVQNLIDEIYHCDNYSIKMKMDENDFPIECDSSICIQKFKNVENNFSSIQTKLRNINAIYSSEIALFQRKLDNLFFESYMKPSYSQDLDKIANFLYSKLFEDNYLFDYKEDILNELKYKNGSMTKFFSHFSNNEKELIVQSIIYFITLERNTSYNYGLASQIFTNEYNLKNSVEWIFNHFHEKDEEKINLNNDVDFSLRKLNMKNVNNDIFKGYHRSGWSYVLSNMEKLHNPKGVIFDSYLDRTFGWDYDFLSFTNQLPYSSDWVGVFHHTFNPSYNYDLSQAMSRDLFIESLPFCKGIIVLSKNNKKCIKQYLRKINCNVPILKLYHPTELVSFPLFDWSLYENNPIKSIFQIGAWLRNTYGIYQLKVPKEYAKFALKGKNMDNYFLDKMQIEKIENCIKDSFSHEGINISGCFVSGNYTNKYIIGLLNNIKKEHDSVNLLSELNNFDYDNILKQNIVFLNLIDAAAVNTIIECIVRNTPIIVNRLPATEEYLGVEYPLFYNNIDDVYQIFNNPKLIKKAHKYLKRMDKTRFSIDFFMKTLIESNIYCSL